MGMCGKKKKCSQFSAGWKAGDSLPWGRRQLHQPDVLWPCPAGLLHEAALG